MIRTYSELMQFNNFDDRLKYLQLKGEIGAQTFGIDRYINQVFYMRNPEWKSVRDYVIVRDGACDLGIEGLEIVHKVMKNGEWIKVGKIFVHHMNPLSIEDFENNTDYLLNPEYLITTSMNTHNLIHFSKEQEEYTERFQNDTCPWRR